MAVETAQYPNSLDASLPVGSDSLVETDDHIRLIKAVIKATFPNLTGPVTATQAGINNAMPVGCIVDWYGALNAIPAGFALCNGQTVLRSDGTGNITTPNLYDRVTVGAGSSYAVGAVGGSVVYTNNTTSNGGHSHGASTDVNGSHAHGGFVNGTFLNSSQIPSHSHTIYATDGGSGYAGVVLGNSGGSLYATAAAGLSSSHDHSINADGSHSHGVTVNAVADHYHSVSIDVRQPYMALAKIMRI